MVQVLPYIPGFGERLADTLTQAGGQLAQGYAKRLENQNLQKSIRAINDPNATPLQKTLAFASMPESFKKSVSPVLAAVLGPQAQAQQDAASLEALGINVPGQTQAAPMYQQMIPQNQAQGQQQYPIQSPQGMMPNPVMPPQQTNQTGMAPNMVPGAGLQGAPQQIQQAPRFSKDQLSAMTAIKGPIGEFAKQKLRQQEIAEKQQFQKGEREAAEQTREKSQIAKENRQEIKEYAKNYENISSLENNLHKLNEAEKLIRSKKVSIDGNWFRNATAAILEGNESGLADLLKTDEQQQLFYLLREALAPKEIGGSNPSTREVILAMQSIPSMYKGQKANEYIIEQMQNIAKINLKKARLVEEAQKKGIKNSSEFKSYVENGTSKYADALRQKKGQSIIEGRPARQGYVWMAGPDGIPREIPESKIEAAEAAEGKRL